MTVRRKVPAQLLAAILCIFCFSTWPEEQKQPPAGLSKKPIALEGNEIGELLRKWYSNGTAAGNDGDYYDNRDGGHSQLNLDPYPQLQKIEYTAEQIKTHQNWGLQRSILPHVTFGNSSTSSPPTQRGSNARICYVETRGLNFLFTQYAQNNLYIYPEHLDHDPGHNGIGGYGDLFPTNTPYLIISQGSSGSDQPFMRAIPYVLAAFRPEVKKKLIEMGLLMPVIQMLMRITNKNLAGPHEYLSGKAHPTVFQGSNLNAKKMVEMAHDILLLTLPPIAVIKVLSEDTPVNGVDYFEPERTEKLADTPAVIARIFYGSSDQRKIIVSAEGSVDSNKRPLQYYWTVLRGDPKKIKISYRNKEHSIAEITVPYQERFPLSDNTGLESNRIDIGVFVHNGIYYSPPAFITFYSLDNETRTYRTDGRPVEIAHGIGTSSISVADWNAFFRVLSSSSDSWPCRFLQQQFRTEELSALNKLSDEFNRIHNAVLALKQKQETANAALKKGEKSGFDLSAIRKELQDAQKTEEQVLQKKIQPSNLGAVDLIQRNLNVLLRDPNLWFTNIQALELLNNSAGKEIKDALTQVKKLLTLYGVAENPDNGSFQWTPLRKGALSLAERLTTYEQRGIERFNAVVLSRLLFPGIIGSEWRANYVDPHISSAREWRDVYRYAPDGTPLGWRRYQADGIQDFNAGGLLVLEKDPQGRCIRARVVRYELSPSPQTPNQQQRKVKLVPTEFTREYVYGGLNDWKGQLK
jgi:hypothetical protein